MFERSSRKRNGLLAIAVGSVLTLDGLSQAATSYSWASPTTGGTWSNSANWTPSTGYPGLTAGDTANLGDATVNRTVFYNSGATTAIGTLIFAQTDSALNLLDVNSSMSITSTTQLGTTSGTGSVDFFSDPAAGTTNNVDFVNGLSINSGGILELETGQNASAAGYTSNLIGSGGIAINGGTLSFDQSTGTISTSAVGSTLSGSLTANSGTLEFGVLGPSGNAAVALAGGAKDAITKGQVNGTVSIASGVTVLSTLGSGVTANQFYVLGSSVNIGTLSGGFPTTLTLGLLANGAQTLSSDSGLGTLAIRNTSSSATANYNDALGPVTSGSTLTIGTISFQDAAVSTIKATLSGNLNVTNSPVVAGVASGGGTFGFETGANTLTFTNNLTLPSTANASWSFTSSTGSGTVQAGTFNLNAAPASYIGAGVTLTATGGNSTTSNLSGGTLATATSGIDPGSTFNYAGTAVSATPAILISSRPIGNLVVTSGALQIPNSNITTGTNSTTTVLNGGSLDINAASGTTLTTTSITSSGELGGTGTFSTTGGVTSNGIIAPGEVGIQGTLRIAGGGGLTLTSTDNANFDIVATNSYDAIRLYNATVTYGGELSINFTTAPTASFNYQIFQFNGTSAYSAGSSFSSIVSNLPASDSETFIPATGYLDVTVPTPEPASVAIFGVASLALLRRRRR